ncbi:hypothetical protein V7S43_004476 [Phytophthora oleae]|uniref:HTH CENPB-type domain-containing protein n=1 Tax=Phytophthora oleae TaxID=2107226 RepID=A0ABD3FUP4_9STRA
MRIPVNGKSRKPIKHKNRSETFEFKSAVLAYHETHSMPAIVAAFWPGIEPRCRAYVTKKRVVLRWRQNRARIDELAASSKTAKLKRYRELGSAKSLSDDVELDIFEWIVAVRPHGEPVSATMLQLEALEIARMYDVPLSFVCKVDGLLPFSLQPGPHSKNPARPVFSCGFGYSRAGVFRNVDQRGSKTVWVKCGSKSKERLTAMLMADSTGRNYDP